jgi:microcystin-dependent protein
MSQPFVGEIRMFAGNFAPVGWLLCQGQLLPISEYDTLFTLIGTTYGGDGEETFKLPDLQGRVPIHQSSGYPIGASGGVETVTLTTNQIPSHTHALTATTSPADDVNPTNNVLAQASTFDGYEIALPPASAMAPQSIGPAGNNQPHENMQPYLCVNFIISLYGIFPQQ